MNRFRIARLITKKLYPSYRFSWPQLDWSINTRFNQYLDRFDQQNSCNAHRNFTLTQLQRLTDHITGDTAECGSYYGQTSFLIAMRNNEISPGKTHHIFDSFQGLSEPNKLDDTGNHWSQGDMAVSEKTVRENLKDFKNIKYYKGWIPDRFSEVSKISFSFVHIDVDLEQPTIDSFAFFYEKMGSGGIIVCDDYGFTTCPGATSSIDNFLKDKTEKMISLADGGGFIIKNTQTGQDLFKN